MEELTTSSTNWMEGTAATQQAAVEAITQSAIDLANVVATVIKKGATHVVVINLPDIGKTPLGASPP